MAAIDLIALEQAANLCGCVTRSAPVSRKRRYSGCGILNIDASVVRSWFKLDTNALPSAQRLFLTCECVRIELLRKGKEVLIATYNAFSLSNDNEVGFYWDADFLLQPPGYYIGDIFINDNYCFTLEFRIRKCETVVVACRVDYEKPCATPGDAAIGKNILGGIAGDCGPVACIPLDMLDTRVAGVAVCDTLPAPDCNPAVVLLKIGWAQSLGNVAGPYADTNAGTEDSIFSSGQVLYFKVYGGPLTGVRVSAIKTGLTYTTWQYDEQTGLGKVAFALTSQGDFLDYVENGLIKIELRQNNILVGQIQAVSTDSQFAGFYSSYSKLSWIAFSPA